MNDDRQSIIDLLGIENTLPFEEEKDMSREWTPDDFYFTGQRVTLNPEGRNHRRILQQSGDPSGYVVDHQASDSDLRVILTNGSRHMPTWNVDVKFDNGEEMVVRIEDLLPVDEFVPVTHYKLDGRKIRLMEGDSLAPVDNLVIADQRRLREKRTFDVNFRNKFVAEAYEKMSSQA